MHTLHLRGFELTLSLIITYFVLFFQLYWFRHARQRIGRRRFFLIVGPLIATFGSAILWSLIHIPHLSLTVVVTLVCLLAVLVTSPWGVIVTYIIGRFVTDIRATEFGIGFSLSVILPSFYAFYMDWLSAVMLFSLTAGVLLALGRLIGTYDVFKRPETKNVNFATH